MDHFYVGRKFSSFDEVQAVIQQYKKDTKVELVIRDCRTMGVKSARKLKRSALANKALLYYHVKLCCIRGGRSFSSRGKGFRHRPSLKIGCQAFVKLILSQCSQYLEVLRMCLDHNHEIEPRPPSRIEKRAENRRQRLMQRMKISYDEAVILERLKVSAKNRLVGPVEMEEDSIFNEESSESSNHFRCDTAGVTSNSELKQTVCSTHKNMNEPISSKGQSDDDDTRLSMDLNGHSNNNSDQDSDILLHRMRPSAKKTMKETNLTEPCRKDNEEHNISDEEDYRRPLIIPTRSQPKKDDSDNSALEQNLFTSKEEDNEVCIMQQNIFTRKGDDGMASTFSGLQLYKDDMVFEALGTIEELSSSIGNAKEFLPNVCTDISGQLVEIQCVLQDMVIHVGTPQGSCSEFQKVNSQFPETHVTHLEDLIKVHEIRLPKVNAIILPSGGPGSTALHVARAICRRAERKVVCLVREGDVNRTVTCYLNRLGDYLFIAARIASFLSGKIECTYTRPSYNVNPFASVNTSTNQNYSIIYLSQPIQ